MRHAPTLAALAAAALFSACATRQATPPELLHAREVVRAAQTSPQVLQHAPLELERATEALGRADRLDAKGEPLDEVGSAAYVAQRRAETAIALAQAKADEDALKAAETDRERMRADARAAEARRAQARAAASQAEATSARVEATVAQQRAEAARLQAGDAEARARAASQQAAALQQQLAELAARPTERGMLVTLGDVLFEFGRAEVKPGARDSLRRLAAYLQREPERRILIEGHTDSVGSDAANLLLSQRRAEAVAAELITLGVAPGRISAQGHGESYPVAGNGSDTDRALNRRVEVYISEGAQPVRPRG